MSKTNIQGKKTAKNRFLRLSDLDDYRVNFPAELAEIGYTVIITVQPNGTLVPQLIDTIPIGQPIDDIRRLNQARSVVASVENAAKRADKISSSNHLMISLFDKKDSTPEISENYHADRVRYDAYSKNLIRNCDEILELNQASSYDWINNFVLSQTTCCLSALEFYFLELLSGKKITLQFALNEKGACQWFFDRFGSTYLNFKAGDDPVKLLYPKSGNFFYLTIEELLKPEVLERTIAGTDELARAYFGYVTSKEFCDTVPIDIKDVGKPTEEFRKLRIYVPRIFSAKEIKEISTLPVDRGSTSGQFSDLITLTQNLFRVLLAIPPSDIKAQTFFERLDSNFRLNTKLVDRPREQFLKTFNGSRDVGAMLALLNLLSYDSSHCNALLKVHAATQGVPLNPEKKLPELKFFRKKKAELESDPQYLERKKKLEPFLLKPARLDTNARRLVSSSLTPMGKAFVEKLAKTDQTEGLAEGVANFLRSFRNPKLANQAVKIMAAQLESGGIYLGGEEEENIDFNQIDFVKDED